MTRITLADQYAHAPTRCVVIDPSGLPTMSLAKPTGC
jgi:hypothetical protein